MKYIKSTFKKKKSLPTIKSSSFNRKKYIVKNTNKSFSLKFEPGFDRYYATQFN